MNKRLLIAIGALVVTLCLFLIFRPDSDDKNSIRLIGEALPPLEALDSMTERFEAETGIKVIVEQYAAEEVHQKVNADIASRTGTYDLILQPHKHLGRLVSNGGIKAIGELQAASALGVEGFSPSDDLVDGWWEEISSYDGKVYGYPFTALTMYVWYRKDLLEDPDEKAKFLEQYGYELKVPEYWDEYRDVAEFFHRPQEDMYGTVIQGKRHDALWYEYLNILYSFGGDILDAESGSSYGPVIINSPEAVNALEYYKSLVEFSPPGTLNFTWDDALAIMQQGQAAMCIMWNDATYAVEYGEDSSVSGKMGFAMVPKDRQLNRRVGQLEGWSYLIPVGSKNPEAAELFMTWMMSKSNQIEQHLGGGASARSSTYLDAEVAALTYTQASLDTMQVALPKPTIPEGPQLTEELKIALSQALSGELSSKEALDKAALEMAEILGAKSSLAYPVE